MWLTRFSVVRSSGYCAMTRKTALVICHRASQHWSQVKTAGWKRASWMCSIALTLSACGGGSDSGAALQVRNNPENCAASTISVNAVPSGVSAVTFLIDDVVLGQDSNSGDGFSLSISTRELLAAGPQSQLVGVLGSGESETRITSQLSDLTADNEVARLYPDVDIDVVTGFPFNDEFMEPLVAIRNSGDLCVESLLFPELVAQAEGENLLYWETSDTDAEGVASLLNTSPGILESSGAFVSTVNEQYVVGEVTYRNRFGEVALNGETGLPTVLAGSIFRFTINQQTIRRDNRQFHPLRESIAVFIDEAGSERRESVFLHVPANGNAELHSAAPTGLSGRVQMTIENEVVALGSSEINYMAIQDINSSAQNIALMESFYDRLIETRRDDVATIIAALDMTAAERSFAERILQQDVFLLAQEKSAALAIANRNPSQLDADDLVGWNQVIAKANALAETGLSVAQLKRSSLQDIRAVPDFSCPLVWVDLGIGCPDPNLCEPPAPIPLEELFGLISNWLGPNVEGELTTAVSGAGTNVVSQLEAQGRLLATLWRNIVEGFIYTDNYTSGRCDVNAKTAYPANSQISKGRATRGSGYAGLARESLDSSNLFVVPIVGNELGQCIVADNASVSLVSSQSGVTRQGALRAGLYYELGGVPSDRVYSLEVSIPNGEAVQSEISPVNGLPVFRVIEFCPEVDVQFAVVDSQDSVTNVSGTIAGISPTALSRVEVVDAENLETQASQVLAGDGAFSIDLANQFVPFKVAVFNKAGEVIYISATESRNIGGTIEVEATNEVTAIISGKANISLAQLDEIPELEGGAGFLPPEYLFEAGIGKVLTIIEAGGGISCCEDRDPIDPPGGRNIGFLGSLDIEPYLGVSGLEIGGVSSFLTGVFLNVRDTSAVPPSDFDFTDVDLSFGLDFYPELNQLFFIGGGKTAFRNETQRFHVPDGATALYLGSLDAAGLNGPPGFFDDNKGAWTVKFNIE